MYRTTINSAGRSSVLSRMFWLVLIATLLFGAAELIGFLSSFVELSRYDELWYLAWL